MTLEKYLDYLTEFLQTSVKNAHANGVIVGISGGIDSAVVAYLAKKAFPDNYLTVWMPIASSKMDWDCANELVANGSLNSLTVDLEPTFNTMAKTLIQVSDPVEINALVKANLKARLRMSTVYALGQANNYLVLGTDNWAEWYTGYFTKYGDGGVDIVPLIHLLKGEVKQAAKLLNVPASIIERKPTAGLWEGQTDEEELGFSYDQIDDFLLNDNRKNAALVERIEELHQKSEHKRNLAIQPDPFKRD